MSYSPGILIIARHLTEVVMVTSFPGQPKSLANFSYEHEVKARALSALLQLAHVMLDSLLFVMLWTLQLHYIVLGLITSYL